MDSVGRMVLLMDSVPAVPVDLVLVVRVDLAPVVRVDLAVAVDLAAVEPIGFLVELYQRGPAVPTIQLVRVVLLRRLLILPLRHHGHSGVKLTSLSPIKVHGMEDWHGSDIVPPLSV